MKQSWLKIIATLGPVGYMIGGGTIASLISLGMLLCLQQYVLFNMYTMILCSAVAFIIIDCVQPLFNIHDPSEIVLDEYVGCLIACYTMPTLFTKFFAFFLFRFFDIVKYPFIWRIDELDGAVGILFDDIVAGIFAAVTVHLLLSLA